MKTAKKGLVSFLALALTAGSFGIALADSRDGGSGDNGDKVSVISVSASATATLNVSKDDREDDDNGTSSREKDSRSTTTATSSRSEGDEHRSEVATFVQRLLRIADRDGGIGAKVREIARDEASSSASTTDAIKKVETRSRFKTFLIGSDFKNLGVIRSELARTDKALERLMALASSTTNATIKAELTVEIKALQDSQAKVKAFVDANENTFSLLGWFVRIFNK